LTGRWSIIPCLVFALLAGCSPSEPLPAIAPVGDTSSPEYVIGPLDSLQVFVWRNPEVSTTVPVRPDGRISTPLIEDMQAAGKTPTQLARDIERELGKFIVDPVATVIVTGFNGPFSQQVRVVGEAAKPQAIAYRENMTLLDVMIAVGGLTEFAAGNRAVLIRDVGGQQKEYRVRLSDLIKNGDVSANARILPGDVLMIPQTWF
jgi:polysaccharide export outer membrane protein